jgi:hypothetical protein
MGVPFGSFSVDGAFAQAVVLSTATRARRQAGKPVLCSWAIPLHDRNDYRTVEWQAPVAAGTLLTPGPLLHAGSHIQQVAIGVLYSSTCPHPTYAIIRQDRSTHQG